MAVFKNIGPLVAGEDVSVVDTVTVDGTATGTPVNVAGWTGTFTLWNRKEDAAAIYSVAFSAGGVNGKLTASIPNATSSTLSDRAYWYKFTKTDSGANATVTEGTITFTA